MTPRRRNEYLFWGGLALAGLAYEFRGVPLSRVTREVFRTDTRTGRVIFTCAWGAFAAWFPAHILTTHIKEKV